MPTFKIVVSQVIRTNREITLEVEADSLAAAIEEQSNSDSPDYDLPGWTSYEDLISEFVSAGPNP